MSEEDYQRLMDLFDPKRYANSTKEESLRRLINAGILDENGNYTEPYKCLEGPWPSSSEK